MNKPRISRLSGDPGGLRHWKKPPGAVDEESNLPGTPLPHTPANEAIELVDVCKDFTKNAVTSSVGVDIVVVSQLQGSDESNPTREHNLLQGQEAGRKRGNIKGAASEPIDAIETPPTFFAKIEEFLTKAELCRRDAIAKRKLEHRDDASVVTSDDMSPAYSRRILRRVLLLRAKFDTNPRPLPSVEHVAVRLLEKLLESRKDCPERPIVFIGHNIGVVVIERALMDSSNGGIAKGQIFRRTAGVIYLSSNDPEHRSTTELKPDYFDITGRMTPSQDNISYKELHDKRYFEKHSEDLRALLKKADTNASDEAYRAGSFKTNARPSAISLFRLLLGGTLRTPYSVFLSISEAITSSLDCYRLLSAACKDKVEELRSILASGVNVNIQDRNGNTALHIAASTGHLEIVKILLVDYEANVALQNSKRRNALFLAVDSERNNEEVVSLLLKRGAKVKDKGENPLLDQSNLPRVSKEIRELLNNPPFVEGPQDTPNEKIWQDPTTPNSAAAQAACYSFRAVVAEFFDFDKKEKIVLEDPTIDELLYKVGPEKILHDARRRAIGEGSVEEGRLNDLSKCRWYHIPANNTTWVKDLFTRMEFEENSMVECQHVGSTPWSCFMRPQLQKIKESGKLSRITTKGSHRNSVVLFMPYLHYEKRSDQARIYQVIKDTNERNSLLHDLGDRDVSGEKDGMTSSRIENGSNEGDEQRGFLCAEENLIRGYLGSQGPLHVRRTLDQSHYYMLEDTDERDNDQVALRNGAWGYTSNAVASAPDSDIDKSDILKAQKNYDSRAQRNMLMVDQLWLWVVGDNVVTSFPRKWTEPNGNFEDDILDRILQHLRSDKMRKPIKSGYDLAQLIMEFCTNVFSRSTTSTQLHLREIFGCSIGAVADLEVDLLKTFRKACAQDEVKAGKPEKSEQIISKLEAISNIDREIESLKEIKDIQDELRMIIRTLYDQAVVRTEFTYVMEDYRQAIEPQTPQSPSILRPMNKSRGPIEIGLNYLTVRTIPNAGDFAFAGEDHHKRLSEPYSNIRDFQKLLEDADAVQDALNHLLDLKQKQANAMEAKFAREAAAATSEQSNIILFLTVVTIVFGSSSSVAAFFALNVGSFPKDSDGTTTWQVGRILELVVGISFGLSIPFIVIAFCVNPLIDFLDPIWKLEKLQFPDPPEILYSFWARGRSPQDALYSALAIDRKMLDYEIPRQKWLYWIPRKIQGLKFRVFWFSFVQSIPEESTQSLTIPLFYLERIFYSESAKEIIRRSIERAKEARDSA